MQLVFTLTIPEMVSLSLLNRILIFCTRISHALHIGNHMISSATWDKSAPLNFSKAYQIARAGRPSAICSLLRVLIYPKLHETNNVITC